MSILSFIHKEGIPMKNIKLVIGLTSFIFCLLICVQSCVISFYISSINNSNFIFGLDLYLGIDFFLAGLLVLLSIRDKYNFLLSIASILYLLGGIYSIINKSPFNNQIIWAIICFIYFIVTLYLILNKTKFSEKIND